MLLAAHDGNHGDKDKHGWVQRARKQLKSKGGERL